MIVTLQFTPGTEASLAALAAARGIDVAELVRRLVEERLAEADAGPTAAQRLVAWREIGAGLPARPLLSDEAVTRESFYSPHG